MKLVLTNRGRMGVPVVSDKGDIANVLSAGEQREFDSSDDVWVIGDKPNFVDGIKHGIETVLKVITFWRANRPQAHDEGLLTFAIGNKGDKAVRVIPGTVETEFELAPNESRDTTANDYIELRELGHAAQMSGEEAP